MKGDSSYIRAISLFGIENAMKQVNCPLREIMSAVGLPHDALDDLNRLISFRATVALYEQLAIFTNQPDLGLKLSKNAAPDFSCLGPSVLMARFVSTLEEWLDMALRYWIYHTNGFRMEILPSVQPDDAILRLIFHGLVLPPRQFSETVVANIVGVSRVVTGRFEESPTLIRFQHRKPNDINTHKAIFKCPIEFDCEHVEIVFPRKYFAYATTASMRLFKPLITLYMAERVKRMKYVDHSTSSEVALAIPAILGSGQCNIETIALSLGMNTKALQRRLAKEDTSFSEIVDRVRENIAKLLLTETDVTISRIAELLDYAKPAPFTSAFQRWTGMSPRRFRQAERIRVSRQLDKHMHRT